MVYFHKVLKEYTGRLNRPMNFIQIGCNDGVMADPISEYIIKEDWQGIFVDADSFYLQLKELFNSLIELKKYLSNSVKKSGSRSKFDILGCSKFIYNDLRL